MRPKGKSARPCFSRLWRCSIDCETPGGIHGRRDRSRLHCGWRGQRRLRARQPPLGRSAQQGAAAGSRRRRPPAAQSEELLVEPDDPHTHRLRQDAQRSEGELALRDRDRRGLGRTPPQMAQGQGAGRIVLDQRAALHPRAGGRLRRLAADGLRGMVLPGRAALFPAGRAPGAGRERISRHGRPAQRVGHHRAEPDLAGARSTRPSRPVSRATTTSTAATRKASPGSS